MPRPAVQPSALERLVVVQEHRLNLQWGGWVFLEREVQARRQQFDVEAKPGAGDTERDLVVIMRPARRGRHPRRERVRRPPPLGCDASPVRAVTDVQAAIAVVPVGYAAAIGGPSRL